MDSVRLRRAWFQVHKWLGLGLAILIIPLALSGSALVWHDCLDAALNPQRAVAAAPSLSLARYEAAALAAAGPGERLVTVAFPEAEGPVVATLARPARPGGGRPARTLVHLHPVTAAVIDRTDSNSGAVRILHRLHGSLLVPGAGRQIVGWLGVAMLLSSLTGLWIWWPRKGGLRRGLRWQRQPTTSGNLHSQAGFWIAIPLAILSLTGAWISFPAFFAAISGDPPPSAAAQRARRMGADLLPQPRLSAAQALAAAAPAMTGPLVAISWPGRSDGKWKISYSAGSARAEVLVGDSDAAVAPAKAAAPESVARLMRRIHDGTGMGALWQTIIFIGGLIPAGLAVTGVLMWLHVRRRRSLVERRREARPSPAM
jgi:uncharacterized iron-regulated membrane protein